MNNGHAVVEANVKLAPHSVEAEEATLGGILLDMSALFDVIGFLKPDDFFIVRNAWIYEAMLDLHAAHESVDYLTLVERIRAKGQLDEVGGASYVTYLINHTPSSIYTKAYAELVRRAAIRRRLLNAASEIASLAHSEEMNTDAVVNQAEAVLSAVTGSYSTANNDLEPIGAIVSRAMDETEAVYTGQIKGLKTGFNDLDNLTGGLFAGDLTILAGRPGMGKTSLLLTMALNLARQNLYGAIFSLEMTKEQLAGRLASMISQVNGTHQRTGKFTEKDYADLIGGYSQLSELPLYIDDAANITPWQMEAKAVRLANRNRLDFIMVDYLQLMSLLQLGKTVRKVDGMAENRNQEIAYISRSLKQLAKMLKVPVISAAQLNRAVESRQDKRPTLSDLRDSGAIEQDADQVIFIYRDEVYNENTQRPCQADLILDKHRHGPTGTVALYFRKELTMFSNLRRTDIDLVGY